MTSCDALSGPHVRRGLRRLVLGACAIVMGGCAALPSGAPAPVTAPRTAPARPTGPQAAPPPTGFVGQCHQTEDDGQTEDAKLRILDNRITQMDWRLHGPRRGSCRFELSDFEQVRRSSSIELRARTAPGCRIVSYHDRRRRTLAQIDCAKFFCTGYVDDDVLPVMFDPDTGGCAELQ